MSFFLSGFFWFIQGILLCLVLVAVKYWTEDKKIKMPYWKWIVVISWLFYMGFVFAFVGTNLGENEPHAATLGAILFGLIGIISAVGIWRFLGFNKKLVNIEN